MTSSDDGQQGVGGPPPADGSRPQEPSPPGQQGPGQPPQQQGQPPAHDPQQAQGAPGQQQGWGPPNQGQGWGPPNQQQGYGAPNQQQSWGPPNQQQGWAPPNQQQGWGPPNQQQGWAPPNQQQGYGSPSQQQGYGSPSQQQGYGSPNQQQGYGSPNQQQYGGPAWPQAGQAQSGGGRRPRWLLPGGIGAGALVVLLIVFFVVRVVLSATGVTAGSGPTGPGAGGPLSGKVAWSGYLPPPQAPSNAGQFAQEYRYTALTSWLGGGVLAIVTEGEIVGVDQKTGKERWSIPAPTAQGAPTAFCGRSVNSVGGLAVIGVAQYVSVEGDTTQMCNTVMLIDLSSGKVRWTWDNGNTSLTNPIHAEIVGNTVVADLTGDIYGLSISSGQPVWQFQDTEVDTVPYDICDDQFMTAGSTLAVLSLCDSAPSVLSQLDPASGKVVSKTSLPSGQVNGQTTGELVSASPAIIAVQGSQAAGAYLVVNGGNIAKIPQTGSYGTLDMQPVGGSENGHGLLPVVVSGSTMVTRNVPKNQNASRTPDDLVAFDLSSGKELWSKNLVNVSQSVPITIQNGNVIAIITGVYEAPPQVFQVSLKSGAAKPMGPAYSRALIETPNFSQLFWQDNHVYGAALSNIGKGFLLYSLS